ncbi:glycosyltransferase [Adonisia turfae]|uniref:Glycosyltransferase n=1 Tax=Adonisia turfae CCMR0081 TaxID=2292702 RepID=A0A6M0RVN3_9CYAN|nr:glycosyltransferase [Adonisia turfae]NEZ59940.1 glycosyltransferase [Adonisia turfae CCMR0081]
MRILIAGTLAGNGGIQSHIRWLAKALSEEKFQVLAVSLGSPHGLPVDEVSLKTFWNKNVQLHCCTIHESNHTNQHFQRFRRLQELVRVIDEFNPDIYLAIGTGWNLFLPPLLARAKPIRIFHEVMSGVPNGWKDSRWCVKLWFDEVIGQSEIVSRTFSKEFGWKKQVSALPALPEPLEITADLPKAESKRVAKGKIKAALFSRLAPHKQAFWLVRQWHTLKEYLSELHIHGSGPEEELIRNHIAENGIEDRVKCYGRYPEGQAYVDLLSSYDLTLLPTIGAEGAPLVLLESMACGVPFLAYGVGGIPDYGTNNPDVFIVAPDNNKFFLGLERIIDSLETGTTNQNRLQQFYINHYSYNALQKQWINYFRKILLPELRNLAMPLMP